jgi:hypothetical protein
MKLQNAEGRRKKVGWSATFASLRRAMVVSCQSSVATAVQRPSTVAAPWRDTRSKVGKGRDSQNSHDLQCEGFGDFTVFGRKLRVYSRMERSIDVNAGADVASRVGGLYKNYDNSTNLTYLAYLRRNFGAKEQNSGRSSKFHPPSSNYGATRTPSSREIPNSKLQAGNRTASDSVQVAQSGSNLQIKVNQTESNRIKPNQSGRQLGRESDKDYPGGLFTLLPFREPRCGSLGLFLRRRRIHRPNCSRCCAQGRARSGDFAALPLGGFALKVSL